MEIINRVSIISRFSGHKKERLFEKELLEKIDKVKRKFSINNIWK